MSVTTTARRISPLLGIWALLISAVLTFAGATINHVVIHVLFENAGAPAEPPPTTPTRAGVVLQV